MKGNNKPRCKVISLKSVSHFSGLLFQILDMPEVLFRINSLACPFSRDATKHVEPTTRPNIIHIYIYAIQHIHKFTVANPHLTYENYARSSKGYDTHMLHIVIISYLSQPLRIKHVSNKTMHNGISPI